GFLDLGLMVVKKRLIDRDFYHLGDDFVWIIPAGVAVLVLVPGTAVALVARLRHGGIRTGLVVGLLAFVGFLDVSARLPFEPWAALLLSGGLALQSGRLAGSHPRALRSLVSRTTPLLAGALLATLLGTIGRRAWTEHRAVAGVPPAAAGARNLLLI